jgi:WD40 repeat protein
VSRPLSGLFGERREVGMRFFGLPLLTFVVFFRAVPFVSAQQLTERHTLKGHSGKVNAVAFTADGSRLATGSDDKTIKVWDTTTGKEIRALTGFAAPVRFLAFSADGKTLAFANANKTVLWDLAADKERGHYHGVESPIALTSDGKGLLFLQCGKDETTIWTEARLLDTTTKTERVVWAEKVPKNIPDREAYGALALSPDGKTVALGSSFATGTVVWLSLIDTDTGKRRPRNKDGARVYLGDGAGMTFSLDGKTLRGAGDQGIGTWEIPSGRKLATAKVSVSAPVAITTDGTLMASGNSDGSVKLWRVPTAKTKKDQ